MRITSAFFAILVVVLGVLSALVFLPFLTYVLASLLLAFVLFPIHRRLAPRIGATISAGVLVALAILAAVLPFALLIGELIRNIGELPDDPEALALVGTLQAEIEERFGVEVPLQELAGDAAEQVATGLTGVGVDLAEAGIHFAIGVLLLVVLVFYLLKDGDALLAWLQTVTPLPGEIQDELYDEANDATWAVLKGHVFVAIIEGIAAGIGLFVAGVPNAGFWTIAMVLLAFLPLVGVPLVLLPAVAYLLVIGDVFAGVLLAVYGATVIAVIDDYLRAYLVGEQSSVNAGVILVGVLGAVYVFGPMGIFVGPIVLALFKSTVEVANEHYDVPTS